MNIWKYLAASFAVAGVVLMIAGPLWALLDSDFGTSSESFGLGDGTVHGEWLPGQIVLMVLGAVFCVLAIGAGLASRREDAGDGRKQ